MRTKDLTMAALLVAIGTLSAHLLYIPVGVAKCFPVQHAINVVSAVLLGPWYAVANAFAISLLRNILGTGSLLAFPGSMLGAFLAGVVFKSTRSNLGAALGEIFGTGILGGIAAYPLARWVIGQEAAVFFFVPPFLLSTTGGSCIGYLVLRMLARNRALSLNWGHPPIEK